MTTDIAVQLAVVACAAAVAVAAAARSTWSPCGLSMLATITPIGERGRGGRYRRAACWFVAGGVLGGLTLGSVMALIALGVAALHLSATVTAAAAALAALVAAASDARVGPVGLPVH